MKTLTKRLRLATAALLLGALLFFPSINAYTSTCIETCGRFAHLTAADREGQSALPGQQAPANDPVEETPTWTAVPVTDSIALAVFPMIERSYAPIGGSPYQVAHQLTKWLNHFDVAYGPDGKIVAFIGGYRTRFGKKFSICATDGSRAGKAALASLLGDIPEGTYAELSLAPLAIANKSPRLRCVPVEEVGRILGTSVRKPSAAELEHAIATREIPAELSRFAYARELTVIKDGVPRTITAIKVMVGKPIGIASESPSQAKALNDSRDGPGPFKPIAHAVPAEDTPPIHTFAELKIWLQAYPSRLGSLDLNQSSSQIPGAQTAGGNSGKSFQITLKDGRTAFAKSFGAVDPRDEKALTRLLRIVRQAEQWAEEGRGAPVLGVGIARHPDGKIELTLATEDLFADTSPIGKVILKGQAGQQDGSVLGSLVDKGFSEAARRWVRARILDGLDTLSDPNLTNAGFRVIELVPGAQPPGHGNYYREGNRIIEVFTFEPTGARPSEGLRRVRHQSLEETQRERTFLHVNRQFQRNQLNKFLQLVD